MGVCLGCWRKEVGGRRAGTAAARHTAHPPPHLLHPSPSAPLPAPLQFEKEAEEADPFGLDAFLSDVRGGKKKGALDDIGKRGGMGAGGGGGSYEDQHAGGSGRRREFVSGGR